MCNWTSQNIIHPRTEGQAICTVLALRWCQAVNQIWVQKLKENAFHLITYFWLFKYPKSFHQLHIFVLFSTTKIKRQFMQLSWSKEKLFLYLLFNSIWNSQKKSVNLTALLFILASYSQNAKGFNSLIFCQFVIHRHKTAPWFWCHLTTSVSSNLQPVGNLCSFYAYQ